MTTIPITIAAEIQTGDIATMLCSAIESGGISYWCRVESMRKPRRPVAHASPKDGQIYPHLDYPLCKGGSITFRDTIDESRSKLVLDLDAIKRGLALMPLKAPKRWAELVDQNTDIVTADVFVQLCLFGDIIYS